MNCKSHLEDTQFLAQFYDCSLPPEAFDHTGHIRLTVLLLNRLPVEQACVNILTGITRYATSVGAAQKFHKTLSWFMVREVHWRMQQQKLSDWRAFVSVNNDLLKEGKTLVAKHYLTATLNSEQAKKHVVLPDKLVPKWHV